MRQIFIIYILIFLTAISHNIESQVLVKKKMEPTPVLTEGPYYKTGSPERSKLYSENDRGETVLLEGRVFDKNGNPLSGVWIDFWQTDPEGKYDNIGFKFRGHTFTDSEGKYSMETMLPGQYTGRTPHIHVKVRYKNGSILTTQIFFPRWSSRNREDRIFNEKLEARMMDNNKKAVFDFVLDL